MPAYYTQPPCYNFYMAFNPSDPTTYSELSDTELLQKMKGWRSDLVIMMQTELMRRNLARMTDATASFRRASKAQAKIDGIRANREFRFAVWTTMISLLIAGAGFYLTWKMNNDALARDAARIRSLYPIPAIVPRGG